MPKQGHADEVPFAPKSILVPVDFSERSLAGFKAAKHLARRFHSKVTLLFVDEWTPAELDQDLGRGANRELLRRYDENTRARLEALAGGHPGTTTKVIEGGAKEELRRLTREGLFDCVVMGTHGHGGLWRFLLGSVAHSTLYASEIPVLTVHAAPPAPWPERILIPVKFTRHSDVALRCALSLAEAFRAKASLLHVLKNGDSAFDDSHALMEHCESLLGAERMARLGWAIESGDPAATILKVAERDRFDLIVLAAHRKTFWKGFHLGMTAERVLLHSDVPVLSIPTDTRIEDRESSFLLRGIRKAQEAIG